jgi:mRNA interferase RelE/StbE
VYKVIITSHADRDLGKLKNRIIIEDLERIYMALQDLALEPRPHGFLRLKGLKDSYRIRAGNYRKIYEINDEDKTIFIGRVARRSESTYNL